MASTPAGQTTVFVDTSAYIALAKADDANHTEAVAIFKTLRQQRAQLVTTNYMAAETHALLLRYFGYPSARKYLQDLDKSRVTVLVHAEEEDEAKARAIIYRYTDKDFSLADAISFAVIGRLKISQAFTFDRHFEQYGVKVLVHGHIG